MHDRADDTTLRALAFKSELAASRKLARSARLAPDAALRRVMEAAAGSHSLAHLLAERAALQSAAALRKAAREAAKSRAAALRQSRHDGPASAWRGWFDGSAHPNPGRCGIGALLLGPTGQRVEISKPAGYGSSSDAEYNALIALLRAAVQADARGLTVYGDSRVVIDDVGASDAAAAPALAHWRGAARELMAHLDGISLRWVPRHKNGDADALSQHAVRRDAPSITPPHAP